MEAFEHLLKEHFDLYPSELELLEGYADQTFRVKAGSDTCILKSQRITGSLLERHRIERELTSGLMADGTYDFPLSIPTKEGKPYIESDGKVVRLLTYLEGDFLAKATITRNILQSLGDLLGRINQEQNGIQPGMVAGDVSKWDLQHLHIPRKGLSAVEQPMDRALLSYFFQRYDAEVLPERYNLPKALIHNDANDWNILTRKGRVSGIIDFGDLCYSWRINELAVALTYVLPTAEDLLEDAGVVIQAYSRYVELTHLELRLLYYLVAGRMCLSLCNSAMASQSRPDSDYIRISERPMRNLLRRWVALSPDKAEHAFIKAAGIPTGPADQGDLLRRRRELFPPSLSLSYSVPITMKRAAFQYMFDDTGMRFLDAYNNIMLVGHCHPHVVDATTRVLGRLNTNTRYLYDELLDYSERLLSYFPPELCRVFLVNSGSAATDLALRLSRAHTKKTRVLALENGYHGNTQAGIDASHYKHLPGQSFPNTLLCPMPKVYGSGKPDDGTAGTYFSDMAKQVLKGYRGEVAAFIAEPIMGCGGQVPLPMGYLPDVYKMVRAQGGICISDEVQVGFGRLGSWNWGYEKYGVTPDMVILGKPMGNGHPIGAVVTTAAVASAFDQGPEFFSSFGGNPVSCAAGLAVLDVLETEDLRAHAANTGDYLQAGIRELAQKYPVIGDVRGDGLFLGVELITDNGKPDTDAAHILKNELRMSHILIGTDGPFNNVLKIKPPLPFNLENSDELIREMARILGKHPLT